MLMMATATPSGSHAASAREIFLFVLFLTVLDGGYSTFVVCNACAAGAKKKGKTARFNTTNLTRAINH